MDKFFKKVFFLLLAKELVCVLGKEGFPQSVCLRENEQATSAYWAKLQVAPDLFSSLELANFHVSIYEHKDNRKSTNDNRKMYFFAPIVILDHKSAESYVNPIDEQAEMRFRVEMWNKDVKNYVIKHVSKLVGKTVKPHQVDILPLEEVILVSAVPSSDYSLSNNWIPYQNEEELWFIIKCVEKEECENLKNVMLTSPEAFHHFKIETPAFSAGIGLRIFGNSSLPDIPLKGLVDRFQDLELQVDKLEKHCNSCPSVLSGGFKTDYSPSDGINFSPLVVTRVMNNGSFCFNLMKKGGKSGFYKFTFFDYDLGYVYAQVRCNFNPTIKEGFEELLFTVDDGKQSVYEDFTTNSALLPLIKGNSSSLKFTHKEEKGMLAGRLQELKLKLKDIEKKCYGCASFSSEEKTKTKIHEKFPREPFQMSYIPLALVQVENSSFCRLIKKKEVAKSGIFFYEVLVTEGNRKIRIQCNFDAELSEGLNELWLLREPPFDWLTIDNFPPYTPINP